MNKLLLIANYQSGIGGINAQVDLLQYYLRKEGWLVNIFSTKGHPCLRLYRMLQLICCARHYNVLHIHACSYWGMLPAVIGIIAGKLWKKRIIITYHGGEAAIFFATHERFVKYWLGKADQVIVLSVFLKDIFSQYNILCEVIPNIVVLQSQVRRRIQIAPRFVSIRHLEPLYDIPCILKAYKHVQTYYPDATLDILGQGSLREQLEEYVKKDSISGVRFIGQVSNQQIYEYLANADIMVSAAKTDNMPVSLLEAMNAGLLVIAGKVGGVPYMIEDGKTGLLFKSEDSADLANKILWALANTEKTQAIVDNAQTEVKKYVWENIKEKLIKIYE